MKHIFLVAALSAAGLITSISAATAQVAGSSTTVGVSITETERVALGWSVKKSLLGKTVYNEAGAKIGKVQDLIVDPERNVSFVIIGAGGFVGMGQHDVAVPIAEFRDGGGKILMQGGTKDALRALPPFNYANDTARHDRFVANANRDIAAAKKDIAALDRKAAAAAGDVKEKLDQQNAAVRLDLNSAEEKLAGMNRAGIARWKEFEGDVSEALARLKKSVGTAAG